MDGKIRHGREEQKYNIESHPHKAIRTRKVLWQFGDTGDFWKVCSRKSFQKHHMRRPVVMQAGQLLEQIAGRETSGTEEGVHEGRGGGSCGVLRSQ